MEPLPGSRAGRHESRPGRRALVVDSFDELTGPRTGIVELPHRLAWRSAELRRFDLDDPYQCRRLYEIVLREAIRRDELRTWLDGRTLRRIWQDLFLPRGIRQAWEDRHPELARSRLAAR